MNVSIILPTYNRVREFQRALNSLLAQTYDNLEIVVVDDNGLGTDTQILIASMCDNLPRVRYLPVVENLGGSLARDYGIQHCTGRYITFLDDDDVYRPDKVSQQLSYMVNHNLDICVCDMDMVNEAGAEHYFQDWHTKAVASSLHEFLFHGVAFTPMIMMKKSVYLASDGFVKTPLFQDHIMMLNALHVSQNIGVLRKPLFTHHQTPGTRISGTANKLEGYRIRYALEKKLCIMHGFDFKPLRENQLRTLLALFKDRLGLCHYSQLCIELLWLKKNGQTIRWVAKSLIDYLRIRTRPLRSWIRQAIGA
ncbi:hypothetical protein BGP77_14865 [Saccharospirillum sp. MSK14-1]|uniref:glycosyltransferase family 2 protein n=1 Tax=Saccharospirillum sp. MSK14-1 TaxID=1897632 RepID=UPI000D36D139|nr:glycosyltransferase family 2 protein [Saccharospirillum sp. MSK14-1]PTY37759.1 hypothetical protein BGP77_14865 [Saccharospirillum sp. MSK14-1]